MNAFFVCSSFFYFLLVDWTILNSKWSAAAREDRTMADWVRAANLTEVFPRGKPTPTWKPSEGPQNLTSASNS